ncbi:hypothetical protein MBGDF03_00903, partial [Thermoplasmatales archaeon SCGC AB-540-F20]
MQSSLVRKGLVLAVIVLFVGASYIPIIGGDQSVLNNIQTKDNYKNNEEPKILFNESKNTYSDKE